MNCDMDDVARSIHSTNSHATAQLLVTVTLVAVFVGTRTILNRIRQELAQLTVVIIGAGPIGMTSALIAVQCERVSKLILIEEQSKYSLENRSYQIAFQPQIVHFLKRIGVDFDHLEGCWHHGCFYTRIGIYLEYIINILHLYSTEVEIRFNTKFTRSTCSEIDILPGRVVVLCCDGSNGQSARILGLSDECTAHSCGMYGAVAALDLLNQTSVPTPERRVHNLTFDLSAYGPSSPEENGFSHFCFKLFGNTRHRYMALAVSKSESRVVKTLRTLLDKSVMRNIFLKCYNTYKTEDEPNISDSYALNNIKFSPRLFEIKLSQRLESVAYIVDCDMFVVAEGESCRSCNFNTGMDVNVGLKSLTLLEPFLGKAALAMTESAIMNVLIYKMDHAEKLAREFIKSGMKEYMFS
ncbi:hypothetical protein ACJMK2_010384 [Sinanodonta woodiana]|uniref:FAD-binding domain-containing protein n=1 Tax=Sinanodonta woodiana TaxID=1069815 RepID=A0ABD3VI89_SINWO